MKSNAMSNGNAAKHLTGVGELRPKLRGWSEGGLTVFACLHYVAFTLMVVVRCRKSVLAWLDSPDLACVLADCTIARELARSSDVHQRHFQPFVRVLQSYILSFITSNLSLAQ